MTETIHLSIVIPAYNERQRLPATLHSLFHFFQSQEYSTEIIVVDDGSTDKMAEYISHIFKDKIDGNSQKSFPSSQHPLREDSKDVSSGKRFVDKTVLRLIRLAKNSGKGAAVRTGVLASNGRFVLFCDADGSTPIRELDKLFTALQEGYNLAIGSRFNEALISVKQPFLRILMGKLFNQIVRMLIGCKLHDTQCGFKLLTGDLARKLFCQMKIDGFSFDVELLFLAHQSGSKIAEIPVVWLDDKRSKVNIWKDPFIMFLELLRIRHLHHK